MPRSTRLARVAVALAACLLLGVGSTPSAAGGSLCDRGGCQAPPPMAVPVPPPVPVPAPVYVYDYPAVPRWTSNGWSYRPVYPGPGRPPPGPILYAPPPYYGPVYVPTCREAFLSRLFGCDRRW